MINTVLGYFKKAQLAKHVSSKTFQITERGIKLLKSKPAKINVKTLRAYDEFDQFIMSRYRISKEIEGQESTKDLIPEDMIEKAYKLHKKNLAEDIIDRIKNCDWRFFETLVMDIIVSLGYGDPIKDMNIRKGSGDEGIDGIIKEDKLGLDFICLQAKKWSNTVGRPEIQKFAGSLESAGTKKGIFITTSSFSKGALNYVRKIQKRIILIDGEKLANLMIDYGVGVSIIRNFPLKQLDTDYFDQI